MVFPKPPYLESSWLEVKDLQERELLINSLDNIPPMKPLCLKPPSAYERPRVEELIKPSNRSKGTSLEVFNECGDFP
jgi:hypothetical protein